jgi:hypothetical protein
VKLINTDGMAFIGPGSEWFWTALSGIILAVTFIAIYRQLRAQRSTNAIGVLSALEDRWNSERLVRDRLKVVVALRSGQLDEADSLPFQRLMYFFEQIAAVATHGHVATHDLWETWSVGVRWWWVALAPVIDEDRAEMGSAWTAFEHLAAAMGEMDKKNGRTLEYQPATVRSQFDGMIASLFAALRDEQDARAGVMPTVPPGEIGQPAPLTPDPAPSPLFQ